MDTDLHISIAQVVHCGCAVRPCINCTRCTTNLGTAAQAPTRASEDVQLMEFQSNSIASSEHHAEGAGEENVVPSASERLAERKQKMNISMRRGARFKRLRASSSTNLGVPAAAAAQSSRSCDALQRRLPPPTFAIEERPPQDRQLLIELLELSQKPTKWIVPSSGRAAVGPSINALIGWGEEATKVRLVPIRDEHGHSADGVEMQFDLDSLHFVLPFAAGLRILKKLRLGNESFRSALSAR
jgi:hypothetical protein